jgi:hypothetical protein
MENKVDSTLFKNSCYDILKEFLTTQYDTDDPLYDIYVTQSYDGTQEAFQWMDEGEIEKKSVIHISLIEPNMGTKTYTDGDIKIQRHYMYYALYCVIDENIEPSRKRKFVLNDLSDKLKAKFDRYSYLLDEFMKISININDKPLGSNDSGLYAMQQTLEFKVDKRL